MKYKKEILRLLKETPDYLSGQELCSRLGVSRTAVWKAVNALKEDGHQIDAVRNRGYRLVEPSDAVTREQIEEGLESVWAGRQLECFDQLDSTNNRAKELAEAGCGHGALVTADHQTAGKGRRGRGWDSPRGTGIWMSLVLRPHVPPSCASMITLVAAMAVSEGINRVTGLSTQIKWPNDIVIRGKKVCGILTEMSAELDQIHYVVTGIGINVNMTEFPEEIRQTATSLRLETGARVERSQVIAAILKAFEFYYEKYETARDLSLLMETYNERLVNRNREVRVLAPEGDYTGISRGIDREGQLLVEMEDGSVRHVFSGEVSVRGIYGYV